MWYMVERKVGKYDVTIFDNHKLAKEFAKPTSAKMERFDNYTLATSIAVHCGYKYKVERRHRVDEYTCEGPLKRVVVRDSSGKVISRSVEPSRSIMRNHPDCVKDTRCYSRKKGNSS